MGRPRVRSPRPGSWRLTCPLVGASSSSLLLGSPDRVSALSRPGTRPGIRPVIRDRQLEGWRSCPGFPSPFGHRRSLLGHPIPAGGLGPPCGRLTGPEVRTPTGLPRSTRTSYDRGGRPLYPGDDGAHPDHVTSEAGVCRSTTASPYTTLQHPIQRGCALRGINEGSSNSPYSGLPLACGRPDGTGRPWALPRASYPADQEPDDARRGGDRPSSTSLELLAQHHISRSPIQ